VTAALIILGAIVGVGFVLWLTDRRRPHSSETPAEIPQECCGQHEICERDSLLAAVSKDIEYYDDEELDRYAGRSAETYNDAEIEEFRNILLTLRNEDIAGWARSLQLRHIILPAPVRDELIMIVAENRASRANHATVS